MHAVYGHVPEFLSLYQSIAYYTQQGFKKYNDRPFKGFSDPQIAQELMQLNNSFWGKTEFSCWKQQAMNELRTIMNAITVQYKATTGTSPCKHCTVHILWRKVANGYPDASVTNIILLPVKILAKNMNKAITESSSLTNTNKLVQL